MQQFLNFPERYKVKKKLNKETFLNKGNATTGECKVLSAYIQDVNILYDIRFEDGSEMLVLAVDIESVENRYSQFIKTCVEAIARAVPHYCMIVAYCDEVCQLFVFDVHENAFDAQRFVVEQCYASNPVRFVAGDLLAGFLLRDLRADIEAANSAIELNLLWKKRMSVFNACDTDIFALEVEMAAEERAKKNRIAKAIAQVSAIKDLGESSTEDRVSDVFDGDALNPQNESMERVFIEFCASQCRKLYNEVCELCWPERIDEALWLLRYMEACNAYAHSYFGKSLDSECVVEITEGFEKGDMFEDEFLDFDAESLKALLSEFF